MQALWLCVAVQTSWQQCCATAFTPIKIGYPHRCAITKHQCSAAPLRARCRICCSVLLCKQAGSSVVPLHLHLSSFALHTNVSTQIKIGYPHRCAITKHQCGAELFRAECRLCGSVLLCKQAGSSVVPLHLHLSRSAIHTGVQSLNTSAVQNSSGQNAGFVALCCCANKLAAVLCHCICTYQVWLSTQVCVHQTPVQRSTLEGKMQALLLCVAVQTSWQQCCTTAFTPIKFGYPHRCAITKHQCSAAPLRARCRLCCSVLLSKQAGSSVVPLHLHLSRSVIHTGVQSLNTSAAQHP